MFKRKQASDLPRLRHKAWYSVDGEPLVAVVYDYTRNEHGFRKGLDCTITLSERGADDPACEWDDIRQWYATGTSADAMNGLVQQWVGAVQNMLDARLELNEYKATHEHTINGYPEEDLFVLESAYARRLGSWHSVGCEIYAQIRNNLWIPDECDEETVNISGFEVRAPTAFREKR